MTVCVGGWGLRAVSLLVDLVVHVLVHVVEVALPLGTADVLGDPDHGGGFGDGDDDFDFVHDGAGGWLGRWLG